MDVVVAGAGKVGSLIACMLADCGDYQVHLLDVAFHGSDLQHLKTSQLPLKMVTLDLKDEKSLTQYLKKQNIQAIISALPFYVNLYVARAARAACTHYFDLTEDVAVTNGVKDLARNQSTAFVPQCGLAPGFVTIVANDLLQSFEKPIEAKLRVGALPQRVTQGCHYSLTWSTEGLINEYGNLCDAIEKGQLVKHEPLEGLETIELDGAIYEAFNTSGGLGSLSELYLGKLQRLNYKTIRYPGHRDKMYFLMHDLKFTEDRQTLKQVFERAIPRTYQDLVIIYVSVEGEKQGEYREKSYLKKLYPMTLREIEWSAIQVSTAAGACAVADAVLQTPHAYKGFVLQEQFALQKILANRFGRYFIQSEPPLEGGLYG